MRDRLTVFGTALVILPRAQTSCPPILRTRSGLSWIRPHTGQPHSREPQLKLSNGGSQMTPRSQNLSGAPASVSDSVNHVPLLDREAAKAKTFFAEAMNGMSAIQNGCLVVVTHFLQDRVPYLEALERLAPIRLLIPKQRSMQQQVYEQLSQKWTVIRHLDRQALAEPNGIDRVCEHIGSRRVVFLDVGGYFSAPLDTYCQRMPDQVIGIVEVTKNGY